MVVERARGESQSMYGSLQSLCWGSSACGGIVSSYFSGSFVEVYAVRSVFGVTALLPLITSLVSLLVKEQPVTRGLYLGNSFFESSKSSIIQLWGAVKQPNATPQSGSATFFFITNRLGFTPEFLGRLNVVTSVMRFTMVD
uniref:Uncharacterized protein n=1 Tax=Solanum lycopersicum TaxID=4081 RepID=A0A3Q7GWN5_SOLLC